MGTNRFNILKNFIGLQILSGGKRRFPYRPTFLFFRGFVLRVMTFAAALATLVAIDFRFWPGDFFVLALLAFIPGFFLAGAE
jgi:hypothetical protein